MKLHTFSKPERRQNRLEIRVDGQELFFFEIKGTNVVLNFRGKKIEYIDNGNFYLTVEPNNLEKFYADIITSQEYLSIFQINNFTENDYERFLSGLQGNIDRYLTEFYNQNATEIKKLERDITEKQRAEFFESGTN